MILISSKGDFYNLTRRLFLFALFIAIRFTTEFLKLLENTLDKSSKFKNMFSVRLGCLTKSLLSQNFYQKMSAFWITVIPHPFYFVSCRNIQTIFYFRILILLQFYFRIAGIGELKVVKVEVCA